MMIIMIIITTTHHDHPLVSLVEILSARDPPLNLVPALRVRAGDVTPPLHQHVTERQHERAQRLVIGHVRAFILLRRANSTDILDDPSSYSTHMVLIHRY